MQNANIKLEIANNVINMMQIFLAVAVLVFSISISTSRYELRAETLRECGDKLKELIRELSKEQEFEVIGKDKLGVYQKRYTDITTDSENHESIDYKKAILDMNNDFIITGFKRLFLNIELLSNNFIILIIPILLISFEIIFITDMFGVTTVFTKYLQLN